MLTLPFKCSDETLAWLSSLSSEEAEKVFAAMREAFKAGFDAAQLKTRAADALTYPQENPFEGESLSVWAWDESKKKP